MVDYEGSREKKKEKEKFLVDMILRW